MSFQHDEQEFDFSYMFEYNQDVQSEPETGGYSTAKEGFFPVLYVLFTAQCERALLCTGINQEKF